VNVRTPSPVIILATAAAWALLACGSVTTSELLTDGGDGGVPTGGADGQPIGGAGGQPAGGAAGQPTGGAGGQPTGGSSGGRGGSGGAGGEACVDRNVPGFALNAACPDAGACHSSCELEGARFVGCVAGVDASVACVSSCNACP
jgi:hypothetical protein